MPLEPMQRALLERRAKQLRKAIQGLERGAPRDVPKTRKLMVDVGGSALAMGIPELAHFADIGHDVAANKLVVYARMFVEQIEEILAQD